MTEFANPGARLYCRDPSSQGLSKIKYLIIVAHSDDAEILGAWAIVLSWLNLRDEVAVVVVNDGVGIPRAPEYAGYGDREMASVRITEQFNAAADGDYKFAMCLDYPSCSIKGTRNERLVRELARIIELTQPEEVFTHNPWDGHPSHIAVLQHYLWAQALVQHQPKHLWGGQVWLSIDFVPDPYLVRWDLSGHEERLQRLLTHFVSQNQIKHYDIAVIASRRVQAMLNDPHLASSATSVHLGVDMTCVLDGTMSLRQFVEFCDAAEHRARMARFHML